MGSEESTLNYDPDELPYGGGGGATAAAAESASGGVDVATMTDEAKAKLFEKLVREGKTDTPLFKRLVDDSPAEDTTTAITAMAATTTGEETDEAYYSAAEGDDDDGEEEEHEDSLRDGDEDSVDDEHHHQSSNEPVTVETATKNQEPSPSFFYTQIHGTGEYGIKGDEVTENDVLCGKGHESHPGKVQFRNIISSKQETYNKSGDKKAVCREVVDLVTTEKGRFLEKHPSEDTYRQIPYDGASKMVGNAFRNERDFCKHSGCSKWPQKGGFCI